MIKPSRLCLSSSFWLSEFAKVAGQARKSSRSRKSTSPACPDFFPLWDDKIARAYECNYSNSNQPAKKILAFMSMMKQIAQALRDSLNAKEEGKTLLKLIDEYNYAKYTKGWS